MNIPLALIAKIVAGLALLAALWFGVDQAVLAPRRAADALQAQLKVEMKRANDAESILKAVRRDLLLARQSERLVATYEEKIRELESRPPVIHTRLVERLCHDTGPAVPSDHVPGSAAGSDEAGQGDAGDGFAARLADDVAACKANAEQLTALQAWVRSVR